MTPRSSSLKRSCARCASLWRDGHRPANARGGPLSAGALGGEQIAAPAGEILLQRVPELRIEARQLLGAAHALPVGRVGDQHAARPRRPTLEHVAALQLDPAFHARLGEVAPRRGDRFRIVVAAIELELRRSRPDLLLHPLPQLGIENAQLLEAEAALRAGRAAARHRGRFHEQRPGPAHRVEERLAALPAAQHDDSGGEVLAQRRLAGLAAPAALEERLAGRVQVQRRPCALEKGVDAHVGTRPVDVRPTPELVPETVADRVLDAQRGEL
ncbi:MAG: hypothetical protein K0S03_1471, partial [Burkholderiales bacterium]|nr:hypothetical protein [Burkholderiales bacterium]